MHGEGPDAFFPPSYPYGGTYADVLYWHLEVWGTRPTSNTETSDLISWTEKDFYNEVFGKGSADNHDSQRHLVKNWLGDGSPPGNGNAKKVANALFGSEPKFAIWAADLEAARKRSGGDKNIREIDRVTALAVLARADSARNPVVSDRETFARAPRENVPLLVKGLVPFFTGRAADIEKIEQYVNQRMAGAARGLLVITAPAGFGKSALAAYWGAKKEHPPQRRIALHLCSPTTGEATTSLTNIYEHLYYQVAEVMGVPIDPSNSFNALITLLSRPPPDDIELVLWLDGIDDAAGVVDCFLPELLGERICIVVSARAAEKTIPAYLFPWLADAMAVSHNPFRHDLGKLPLQDVEVLVGNIFNEYRLAVPKNLGQRIFNSSDKGHALFAFNMVKSALADIQNGRKIDLGKAPESLRGYAESELRRLGKLGNEWRYLKPLFALLAIAKDAVPLDQAEILLGGIGIDPESFPDAFLRWLNIVETSGWPLLSFAHPKLQEVFGQALGPELGRAHNQLCNIFVSDRDDATALLPFDRWPSYALKHLPRHLLDADRPTQACKILMDLEFIEARFAAFGVEAAPSLMADDWMVWHSRTGRKPAQRRVDSTRHQRFWNNLTADLSWAAGRELHGWWRLLMAETGIVPLPSGGSTRERLLPMCVATLPGHQSYVSGALELADGAGFLSWSGDKTLRFWGPMGKPGNVLHGHEGWVEGALALADGAGFLSWGQDNTPRLWKADGESGPELRGHKGYVYGALALADGAGFLTWSRDHTLRLWGPKGEPGPELLGHKGRVDGALALADGAGFLSWSGDHTLRLWGPKGEPGPEMLGHEDRVVGALALADGAGFLSWSDDHTLRLWGPKGEPGPELLGHKDRIEGALALADGAGFLSWSDDHALRLWGPKGEPGPELLGHEGQVRGALALTDRAGFLSWGHDDTLRLWGGNGERGPVLHGHQGSVWGVMALADGAGFLSFGFDHTLRLWELESEIVPKC